MDELVKALRIAFATEYAFVIKAQNFHWNVEGMFFQQFHELFGEIYEESYASIDAFAENIRKTGGYAPASFQRFSMLSQIEDENNVLQAQAMVAELLQDSEKLANIHKMVFDLAERAGEHGLADFLAGRQDAHRKHQWMLRVTLK